MGGYRAVLLDRDGVLNKPVIYDDGSSHPPQNAGAVELTENVLEALQSLSEFVLVGVTNQPDVARGTQTEEEVRNINAVLLKQLPLRDILTCCHDDADKCDCRKPRPGLLFQAAKLYQLDLKRSFMIGDRWKDIGAGKAAGCRTILLSTSVTEACLEPPEFMCSSLLSASRWILKQRRD